MSLLALAALICGLAGEASAQSTIIGDAWILGKTVVGTTTVDNARFTVLAASATETPFQVSGVDLTPFLKVAKDGKVGLSTSPAARLDVSGAADASDIAAFLRSGNLSGEGTSRVQLALGVNGSTDRRHTISSVHLDSTAANSIDLRIWTPAAGSASSLPTMTVASLATSTAGFAGGVHVMPVGGPQVELTVSNGSAAGGGTIHVLNQVTPSSRAIKRDIAYLDAREEDAALERMRSLRHVSFRYMKQNGDRYVRDGRSPLRRGLIYEEAPEPIKGPFDSLSLDQRLVESELAFKALARRLEAIEREAGR